jgi:hypothetical protein
MVGDDIFVNGELVATGGRDPAWTPSGRLGVAVDAGIAVDGDTVAGTQPGDSAPSWLPARPKAELLLPDLDQRAPSGLTVDGSDGRFRLGFTSATDNVGRGRLWIRGLRTNLHANEMSADQIVQVRSGGIRIFRGVGRIRFVDDPPHHHWHLLRFQEFELRRPADASALVRDRKTGFCLADHYDLARDRVASFDGPYFAGNCGQGQTARRSVEMGTSVGYTDRYRGHFHGQSLELAGVPPGVYVLVHRVNPAGPIRELRYDNNAASARIRIAWPRGRAQPPSVRILRSCPGSERC